MIIIMIHNYTKFCFISPAQVYVNFCTQLYIVLILEADFMPEF